MANEIFALAFEACPAAMLMVSPSGRIELVNTQCEAMFGFPPGGMVGLPVEALLPEGARDGHREMRDVFQAQPTKRMMGVGRDLRARRRDGGEFPVEIGLTPVVTPEGPRVLVFAVDISGRVEAERRLVASMSELRRANQNLASFAYVASHDIQEPLRKICAFAEVLEGALARGDAEETRYAAGVMAQSAQRARRLVASLLTYARSLESELNLQDFSMRGLVDEVLEMCAQSICDRQARVETRGADFCVRGDREQTLHLLVNFLTNALKYAKPGQAPQVRIMLTRGERENRLSVEDEGVGFAEDSARVIFEPFRRLHGRDAPGEGIGLAICQAVASRHGWRLSARGRPGRGAKFEVGFASRAAQAS
ncbi:PAS domain S-box-containing protein [Rhodoblastus acidophilus]|uniref:sensor histidine kinase n=1 Tax=Rhodoblastus acidophilus TaxID=1074 RepID=UPI002224555E|nr:ATP-binding protein [Rhodoblastus acidophilus]MCW2283562.1 PAS domain S-box-containing protein [Rhodoblastus acidophilus]MCW2332422.1 PAS domain S-box-containing protein [Rhodoblastus acidophilus]